MLGLQNNKCGREDHYEWAILKGECPYCPNKIK